jgi:hypothetical protein
MQHELERFGELTQVEPPASLDALVRERMQRVLLAQGTPVEGQPRRHSALVPASPFAHAKSSHPKSSHGAAAERGAVSLPLVERCVYAVGLVTYGAHALGAAVRLLWRAVSG